MRKVILYIAMSLDGYIADLHGKVDWLNEYDSNGDEDGADSYSLLLNEVDTVVMGYNTYHQIVTELSPERWVYEGLSSYVVTHSKIPSTSEITFVNSSPGDLVKSLKKESGKDIWICGGANIISQLMQEGLIDKFHISVIPIILGNGIRLFHDTHTKIKLDLVQTRCVSGMVELLYTRR